MESTNNELLKFIQENGIVNLDDVQNQMNKKRKAEILKQHPFTIWQGKDSRYRTYIEDLTKESGRRMIVKSNRNDLEDFLCEMYENKEDASSLSAITLTDLYPEWIKYKSAHTTAGNYIRRIKNDWKKYYANTKIVTVPIVKLDKLALDLWAHTLIKEYNMTKKQYYNCTIIMRQSLVYAVDRGIITISPFSTVKIDGRRMFRTEHDKPDYTQVYLKDELNTLHKLALEHFHTPNRLANKLAPLSILFQFQTGVRLGELCVLRYDDIIDSTYLHVQRLYRYETREVIDHTKSHEDRKVLLTSSALQIIETAKKYQQEHHCNCNGYIFSMDNAPLSYSTVEYLYKKYCKQMGIIHKSSHKSRKTYISALIDGKVNINTIRKMVGHSDERTTLGCYCFDRNGEEEKKLQIEHALCS